VKHEKQNPILEPPGLAKPGKSGGLIGMGPGFARQQAVGQVFE